MAFGYNAKVREQKLEHGGIVISQILVREIWLGFDTCDELHDFVIVP
jgi:hypothetical protein